jgi:hypothetical protein
MVVRNTDLLKERYAFRPTISMSFKSSLAEVQRLVEHRRELEEVADQDDTEAAKELVAILWEHLPQALVDPREGLEAQHTLLVDHEVVDAPEPPLRGSCDWETRESSSSSPTELSLWADGGASSSASASASCC